MLHEDIHPVHQSPRRRLSTLDRRKPIDYIITISRSMRASVLASLHLRTWNTAATASRFPVSMIYTSCVFVRANFVNEVYSNGPAFPYPVEIPPRKNKLE